MPQIDNDFFVSRNLFVRVLFRLRRRRSAEEEAAAIEREAQIGAFAYNHLFAKTRTRDRDDLSGLRVFAVPVIDAKLRLLRFGVFFIAGEGELSVFFVPRESLIFSFSG